MKTIQGQSDTTEEKHRGFQSVFTCQMGVLAKAPIVFHFDLNAGCGHNYEVDVEGSPLLFQRIARSSGANYRMVAIEREKSAACELAGRLLDDPCSFVIHGDNRDVVPAIPYIIREFGDRPEYALGQVILDPNGCRQDYIPFKQLAQLANVCPRIDIVFNYPATAMIRERRSAEEQGRHSHHYFSPDQFKAGLRKKHWWIRHPLPTWKFTMIVGRNFRMGDHKKIRLYEWDSDGGKQARHAATYANGENPKQRWLDI